MAGITDLFKIQTKEASDALKEKGTASAATAMESGKKYFDDILKKVPALSPSSVSKPKVTPSGDIKVTPVTSVVSPVKRGKSTDLFKSKGGFVMYGIIAGVGFFLWKFLKKKKST